MNEATSTVPLARIEINLSEKEVVRFWSKVDKNGPLFPKLNSPCWLWMAFKSERGYGQTIIKRKPYKSHRVSWMLVRGPIPHLNLCVCHHCDNPSCVNPDHLFLGTHTDNMRDKENKGRGNQPRGDTHYSRVHPEKLARGDKHGSKIHPERLARGARNGAYTKPECVLRGERQGQSKLTDCVVTDIRTRYAAGGVSCLQLARIFNVSKSLIIKIVSRKTWRHLP